MWAYLNDKLIDGDSALISLSNTGFQFGLGVFETVLIKDGQPRFMDLHYKRLVESFSKLGLKLSISIERLEEQGRDLSRRNLMPTGRLKVICFKDIGCDSVYMTLAQYDIKTAFNEIGFKLTVSSIKRNPYSPIPYIKSLNYAENILAREAAAKQGYDEALFLNVHNQVAEGSVSNIFWIKNKRIYTPEINCGILAGITRSQVFELCSQLKLEIAEGCYDINELRQADEVFVTNSLMGIMPVCTVDNNIYKIEKYEITRQIYHSYNKLLEI